jgi:hypothetical protein
VLAPASGLRPHPPLPSLHPPAGVGGECARSRGCPHTRLPGVGRRPVACGGAGRRRRRRRRRRIQRRPQAQRRGACPCACGARVCARHGAAAGQRRQWREQRRRRGRQGQRRRRRQEQRRRPRPGAAAADAWQRPGGRGAAGPATAAPFRVAELQRRPRQHDLWPRVAARRGAGRRLAGVWGSGRGRGAGGLCAGARAAGSGARRGEGGRGQGACAHRTDEARRWCRAAPGGRAGLGWPPPWEPAGAAGPCPPPAATLFATTSHPRPRLPLCPLPPPAPP